MVTEQFEFQELLYQMTLRDLLLRYKQTLMGFGWAVFMPLLNTAVFSVIFTRVAPIKTAVPYPLFAYCGLLTWNFFSSALRFSVISLTGNSTIVTKVYFPREILPFSAVLVSIADLAVASLILVALMIYYGTPVTPAIVYLPLVVAVHVIFTAALALVLAMGNLFYRDVKYLFEVVVTMWMFATSVLYPVDVIGGRLGVLMRLNPMTQVIDGYRHVLLQGESPLSAAFMGTALFSTVLLIGSWLMFHRSEFSFAENI